MDVKQQKRIVFRALKEPEWNLSNVFDYGIRVTKPKRFPDDIILSAFPYYNPGRVTQCVVRLTQEPEVPGRLTYFRFVVSYWRKYLHEVLVNHLGGLSLPRESVVRLTDSHDMTLAVYRGRKAIKQ